jgi:hypothetical protein
MNGILAWLVKEVLIEFIWKKMISGFRRLRDWWVERGVREDIVEGNDRQADLVESISAEITALLKMQMNLRAEGRDLTPAEEAHLGELYEKLKVESRKLAYRASIG